MFGDRVTIDLFGSKHHNKSGVVYGGHYCGGIEVLLDSGEFETFDEDVLKPKED